MRIIVPKRFTAAVLSVLLGAGINVGCKNDKLVDDNKEDNKDDKIIELVIDETTDEVNFKEPELEEEPNITYDETLAQIEVHKIVKANANVKLREEAKEKAKQIGFLIKNEYLTLALAFTIL